MKFARLMFWLLMILCPIASHAFEYDGFVSGMEKEKVISIFEQRGLKIEKRDDPGVAVGSTVDSSGYRWMVANFCDGKLVLIAKHFTPTTKSFIGLTDEMIKTNGQPTQVDTKYGIVEETGDSSSITLRWNRKNEHIGIKHTVFTSNDQVDVTYSESNACTKKRWGN